MINWTPPGDPRWEEFYRIVIDEAAGRLPVHGIVFGNRPEYDQTLIRRLEALGVDLILLASTHAPDSSADDLDRAMAARIEATELPVMLYAALGKGRNFPHLGPSGQPLDVYDRLADLPNLVAVKISQPVSLISTMQLCARLGDRLSMGPVNLDFVPLLARHFRIAWSGQWNAEAVQTPSRQLGNRLLAASATGDFAALDAAAKDIQPVLEHFFSVQADVIRSGAHPWQHNKYYSWLGGGNGGLMPEDAHAPKGSVPILTAAARRQMRNAFVAAGLTVTDAPDDAFIVGLTGWSRGTRSADMTKMPHYSDE
jgi:4-hydroxy-tetrahydrodipicolinate synthase